ncbi:MULTISPECIES: UTRA domain-containing protein [Nitrincola]|uniref:HTH-type transcriptional repressor yvoA n=1 Tax=Nitrincola nitratireducens TaxID=1229521 RepID=W9URJ1_9GAMM|nr:MULTISPECIES: UTRA domain-containing protein [Nitrincola]EXJ09719.1 HTH-type transcriptional repressor yvoA [Nitrincola nitratireducens]
MSDQPLYLQLRDQLLEHMARGALQPGTRLPSERALAETFETTRVTLRQALAQLESEGAIYRSNRRGWFVSAPRLEYDPVMDISFTRYVADQGRTPRTEVVGIERMPAPVHVAKALKLGEVADVYLLRRKRYVDERLVFIERIWLNPIYLPHLDQQPVDALWKMLNEKYGIELKRKQITITPIALIGSIAEALDVNSGCPGLFITRLGQTAKGEAIEYDEEYWLHDVLTIRVSTQSL